eukprot:CAMPEP_0177738032 /NCGR_PEP_ID=MMETSP0484_2-20121128/26221_1 /TAXON_ID=354590 /ORGANISM="Rhodomonas lens, Strain RHODO" /LENGTH=57 /DNA_ID=CAMNT_0019251891 /DNA_START=63 /DNA_END=233 /DNA_ORIENTATION=+
MALMLGAAMPKNAAAATMEANVARTFPVCRHSCSTDLTYFGVRGGTAASDPRGRQKK